MLIYNSTLLANARRLRKNMTESEQRLWYHLRRKQLLNIQFFRQRPIGSYIVDFYAPRIKLVIESDGSQHFEPKQLAYDGKRSDFLEQLGIKVLRFNNVEVLQSTQSVLECILQTAMKLMNNR